jgi:subfamily B ATP-binding cassette protein HlyB/CyaB
MTINKIANLENLEPFTKISKESLIKLKEDSKIYLYTIGLPLCTSKTIPNKILLILEGQGRLIVSKDQKQITLGKLNPGSFVGLASFISANPCEEVTASTELKALAISDEIILYLLQNEQSFYDWCSNNYFYPEIFRLSEVISNQSKNSDLDILNLFESIVKDCQIKSLKSNTQSLQIDNKVCLLGSSNLKNSRIGDLLETVEEDNIIAPLPLRLIYLSRELYSSFFKTSIHNSKIEKVSNSDQENINQSKIVQAPLSPLRTGLDLGQDFNNQNIKIIKAKGVVEETSACLKMIADFYNVPFRSDSIEKVIRDSINRGDGTNSSLIANIANMMGLHVSGAGISIDMASRLETPCVVHWNKSFAIITKSNSKGITLASPKSGWVEIESDEIKESFPEGFLEILLLEKTNQTPGKKFGFEWFWASLKKYRAVLLQVFLASFVVQLFGLANPLLIQVIIDKVINQRSLETLQILGFALVVVTILGGILGSLRTYLFAETTNRIDSRLGAEVIDHLLRLPLNYFDRKPVGELGSRIAELEKIRDFLTGQALTTILDATFSVIYIIVMLIYSWLLTLIALAVVPIQILITVVGTPLIRRQIRNIAIENASTQSHLVEVLTGIQTVKAQNIETVSRWKWQKFYNKFISKSFEKTITTTTLGQTSNVLQQLSQLLVLWIGATLVLNGQMSLGQLIAFRIISGYVTQPLLRLSTIWQNVQELRVSFERLADIVDTPEESSESDRNNIPLPQIKGEIKFENVYFKFKNSTRDVLSNINLTIKEGQFVGVVGQSGSGKSTLMKLLPRLYEIETGKLSIDNYQVNKVELYSLRRQIGIVPQDPLLFAGSISDNIALTNPEAPSSEIVRAAKVAGAHDFIMDLPDGYSTLIGERGSSLSGGQRQRIAIARTILGKSKLLILDEATSALDYNTERMVCEGIRHEFTNSTVFFITHRLSTVKNADEIIMLHEGRIAEQGTHEFLMNKKGRYYALYEQQGAE